ncbi:TetR family transcriptional regulator [Longispora sp. K20-0274]|uniref:TetR/AcrR family transcriptional regulator n=1 Tax=Longispora sp. K20-0274 TaxID=3088255 RepID=UPI00399987BB
MEVDQPIGLRETKKAATRRALSLAALQLAKEHGLDNVRVEAIAAAAGVSPRTYNNYFSSREEAICALGIDRAERLGAHLRGRPAAESLAVAIRRALAEFHACAEPDREMIMLIMRTPTLAREFMKASAVGEQTFAAAIAERIGQRPGRLDVTVLAAAVYAASREATKYWLRPGRTTPFVEVLDEALLLLAPVADAVEAAGRETTTDPRESAC